MRRVVEVGSYVTLGGGTASGTGYLSEPSAPCPAVLVVHDDYGALPHVRQLCDELMQVGFVALAPDLYDGRSASTREEAERLVANLDVSRSRTMLAAAARQLKALPVVQPKRVGAVGFSLGGWLTLLTATGGALDAAVTYCAVLLPAELHPVGCPVLLHFAGEESAEPDRSGSRFAGQLAAAGTPVTSHRWAEVDCSFPNADLPGYAPAVAAEAWQETIRFLDRQLRTDPGG